MFAGKVNETKITTENDRQKIPVGQHRHLYRRVCIFNKNRLQHRRFPVNIAKYFNTIFYRTHLVVASESCNDSVYMNVRKVFDSFRSIVRNLARKKNCSNLLKRTCKCAKGLTKLESFIKTFTYRIKHFSELFFIPIYSFLINKNLVRTFPEIIANGQFWKNSLFAPNFFFQKNCW